MAKRALFAAALLAAPLFLSAAVPSRADGWNGLLDVPGRMTELRKPEMAAIRSACLKVKIDPDWRRMKPIAGLEPTEGYGSDNSAEDFSWAVMVLSGRTLAGDRDAKAMLTRLLLAWADAGAFGETVENYDSYYALKRQLLPLAVAYEILAPQLKAEEADRLKAWIDPLVRRVDKVFDGGMDVNVNNHRTLADSVLTVWGAIVGDDALVDKGLKRFETTLSETRADGTLALEARRGARALWYQRQTLSSLTVIAEVARGRDLDLYASTSEEDRGFATLLGALMNGLVSPILVTVYSAENHIPGPEKDYLKPDLGFLETRGHGRHYMAFAEAAKGGGSDLSFQRLQTVFAGTIAAQRPLIDEFSGGNATCFWGRP